MAAIGDLCNREVVIASPDTTVTAAAKLMRRHRGGGIVVVDEADGGLRMPVGILTVDDLLDVLAEELGELTKVLARERAREAAARR